MDYRKYFVAASAALMIVIAILLLSTGAWSAGNYKTLHNFTPGTGGINPDAGVVFDTSGNLYGTAYSGGSHGAGTVFELSPKSGGGWAESTLYTFTGGVDGGAPFASLIFDKTGNLYSTTVVGGTNGAGVVFKLTPSTNGGWTESVLYSFTGGTDGAFPYAGLVFDAAGNLYGTTNRGGKPLGCRYDGCGVVFELAPNSDGTWTESVIHQFSGGGPDGAEPWGGLIIDAAGNLYGTDSYGGRKSPWGVVFRLTPKSAGRWIFRVLYQFTGGRDGAGSEATLTFDSAGNLYGTVYSLGAYGWGNVFELILNANGSWKKKTLHQFTGGKDGAEPMGRLIFDQAGNLYGTTFRGGDVGDCHLGCGVVYKLSPNSKGGWNETVLHTFTPKTPIYPSAGLILDGAGNLYGTVPWKNGSVFEITP